MSKLINIFFVASIAFVVVSSQEHRRPAIYRTTPLPREQPIEEAGRRLRRRPSNFVTTCFLSNRRCIKEETFLNDVEGKKPYEIVDLIKTYNVYHQAALLKAGGDLGKLLFKVKPEVERLMNEQPHNVETVLNALRFLKPDASYCNIAEISHDSVLKNVARESYFEIYSIFRKELPTNESDAQGHCDQVSHLRAQMLTVKSNTP